MPENIFADAKPEGDAIENAMENIAEQGKADKTASESQPEKKEVVKEPSKEGEPEKDNTPPENIPFHKHPRWIALNKKNKELEEKYSTLEQKLADVEPLLKQPERLPDWWARRYGETEESQKAYREYQENTQQERERIKEEVLTAIRADRENDEKEEENAKETIEGQLEEMQDEGLITRELMTDERGHKYNPAITELMKFIVDFQEKYGAGSLLDAEGNYDLRKSLELMQTFQPKAEDNSVEMKRKMASNIIRSKVAPTRTSDIPVVKPGILRRGSWRDAE
jgi:uncharacterized membrane-anchored protein